MRLGITLPTSVSVVLSLLCITLTSCIKSHAETVSDASDTHVYIIAFDGWGSISFSNADMPFLKSKLEESAWTLKKRSVLPTSSACNWATMFKGVGPEAHGYIDWDTRKPAFETTIKDDKGNFPSIFSLFRESFPKEKMVYFYQWEGMRYIVDIEDFDLLQMYPNTEKGSDEMASAAVECIINDRPALAAFIWDYPDKIGHSDGWYTEKYMDVLKHLDGIIESIVHACETAGIIDNAVFIVTSDHGGHDRTHGQALMSDLETPFFVFGKGIFPGEIQGPFMQYDVAAVLADYLNIKHPSGWRGVAPEGVLE